MLSKLIHELYALISNSNLKDIVIINQTLANNNSGFLNSYILLTNHLKISTLNIDINHNQNNIILSLNYRKLDDKVQAYLNLRFFRLRIRFEKIIDLIEARFILLI